MLFTREFSGVNWRIRSCSFFPSVSRRLESFLYSASLSEGTFVESGEWRVESATLDDKDAGDCWVDGLLDCGPAAMDAADCWVDGLLDSWPAVAASFVPIDLMFMLKSLAISPTAAWRSANSA